MSVTVTNPVAGPYTPNSATTTFAFAFKIAAASEIAVMQGGVVLSPSLYTVLPTVDGEGGSVIFNVAPLTGSGSITLISDPLFTQGAGFGAEGPFSPKTLTALMDRAAIRDVRLRYDLAQTSAKADATAQALALLAGVGLAPGNTIPVASRFLLALLSTSNGAAYLYEAGREGVFLWNGANLSAQVTADPLQGLYVPPTATPTGASGAWVRQWDGINGRPEWFGAIGNNIAINNVAALTACITNCPVTRLAKKTYYTQSTIMVGVLAKRTILGVPGPYDADGDSSAIKLTGANAGTATILQMGPTTPPATLPNNVGYESRVIGVNLLRDAACVPHASGLIVNYPTGIDFRYNLACFVDQVKIVESSVGIQVIGAVNCDLTNVQVTRNNAGTSATNDFYIAYLIGGAAGSFGYVGANASLRLKRCIANGYNAQHVSPRGMLLYGFIADTWIDDFESFNLTSGIVIDGSAGSAADTKHVDVTIQNARIDGGIGTGILITNLNSHASVDIINPYVAPAASATGQAAIRISSCLGGVTISSGQLLCFAPSSSLFGVDIQSSSGVHVDGTKIVGAAIPVNGANSSDLHITPMIYNPTEAATGAAVVLTACSVAYVAPIVKGGATRFSNGVNLVSTGNSRIEVNWTKINPACLTGALATNRLIANAATITATGTFGTNCLASGA